MAKNMTEGKPLKLILAFMIPVFCGGIFQNFYNVVDSMIVGRYLGVDALAAVGGTGPMNFLVFGWIMGMTSGFGILLSQEYGAKNEEKLKHYTAMSAYLCVVMAIIMTIGLLLADTWLLHMMNIPKKIFTMTSAYIRIIYIGLPVTTLYNMLTAIARAFGDSKTPLYFLIISSILNIILDFMFVAVMPYGVAGAAAATVLSQGVSAILCLIYVWKKYEIIHFTKKEAKVSFRSIWSLLMMGIPMALQFSITALGGMIVQSSLNMLGAMHIAAYSTANKIQNIILQVFPSLGSAVATYVGQNYGAGKMDRIKRGVNSAVKVVALYSVVIMFIAYFILPSCVQIFTEDPTGELQNIAKQMFHICMWFYFPLGLIFVYRNALQGLGNGFAAMFGGVFELLARALVIFLVFDSLQFVGICISDPAAWVSALIPLIPYYYWYMKKSVKSFE